jgi:hypothetical protein
MIDGDRRRFLKQLGAATTLTAAAGCLDGGESNGTPTDNGSSSPPSGQGTEGEPDGDQAPNGEDAGANSDSAQLSAETFEYLPSDSELEGIPEAFGNGPVYALDHAYPAVISNQVSDDIQNYLNQENIIAPGWGNFGIEDIDERLSVGIYGNNFDIYNLRDSAEGLVDEAEEVGELNNAPVYHWEDSAGNTRSVIQVNENTLLASSQAIDATEAIRESYLRMIEASEGERNRFLAQDPVGQTWSNLDYRHIMGASMDSEYTEGNQIAQGRRILFDSDAYEMEQGPITGEGFDPATTEEREADSFLRTYTMN